MINNLTSRHGYPGKLFVVEGIDGSGKTTQLALLEKWLSAAGHSVVLTEWNSSALVKAATKTGKKKNALTPMTFSLLHATDFADRLLYNIIPPLKAGMIVLADRYAYTAFARDTATSSELRVEAVASLGVWGAPSPMDRVDGFYHEAVTVPARANADSRTPTNASPRLMLASTGQGASKSARPAPTTKAAAATRDAAAARAAVERMITEAARSDAKAEVDVKVALAEAAGRLEAKSVAPAS